MVDLEIIRNKVKELEKETTDKIKIVEKLQEINECFLQNYIIKIYKLEIYPVEVESYYYNYNKIDKKLIFDDGLCHKNELQNGFVDNSEERKRFGKIYFHRRSPSKDCKINTGYGGIDICLSLGDYFLSILIRSAYINNKMECGINKILQRVLEIKRWTKVDEKLERKYKDIENEENVLKQRDYKIYNSFISHPRIKNNEYFKDNKYLLNTFTFDELKNLKNNFYTQKRKNEIRDKYKPQTIN